MRYRFFTGVLFFFAAFVARADQALLLTKPQDAARVRLDLIHEARSEILVSAYIFKEDRVGLRLAAELREAAKRGREVTVIVDATARFPRAIAAELERSGVKMLEYHPISVLRPLRSTMRLHDKLFIVDGREMVMGDRNIGNNYYALSGKYNVSKDSYLEGDFVQEARDYFLELAASGEVEPVPTEKVSKREIEAAARKLDHYSRSGRIEKGVQAQSAWRERLKPVSAVEFFHDPIGLKGQKPGVETALLQAIRRARKSIVLENPYVLLPPDFRDALRAASANGARVELITNSEDAGNNPLLNATLREQREFFASIGGDVWEHPGPKPAGSAQAIRRKLEAAPETQGMLHSKTMTVDGLESFVMSYNLDPRSRNLNSEVAAHIVDPFFAQELLSALDWEKKTLGYRHTVNSGTPADPGKACSLFYWGLSKILKSQL